MKLLFICSSLEFGKDGVGDYTRRLATELIRQGHSAAAISLNDKYVLEQFNGSQQFEGVNLPVLRLPAAIDLKARVTAAKKYVGEFSPDWLSLQFVIFGYHPKGLPLGLGDQLLQLGKGRQWHIMFHELWVGMDIDAAKKTIVWGRLQRWLIRSLLKKIRPVVIHTHTALYQHQIAKLYFFSAGYLPLIGNIPNNSAISKADFSFKPSLNFVLFGNIFPNTPLREFVQEVASFSKEHESTANLTIIGRTGPEQKKWVKEWNDAGMMVNVLNEQPVKLISETLTASSMGISTTPISLIGKSGAVAAMHEHGLPVICVPHKWHPRGFQPASLPQGVFLYEKGNLEKMLTTKSTRVVLQGIQATCKQFISDLENS